MIALSHNQSAILSCMGCDLAQPCRKFAGGLSELFEEVSLEELVSASELVVQFLVEEKVNENQLILL